MARDMIANSINSNQVQIVEKYKHETENKFFRQKNINYVQQNKESFKRRASTDVENIKIIEEMNKSHEADQKRVESQYKEFLKKEKEYKKN